VTDRHPLIDGGFARQLDALERAWAELEARLHEAELAAAHGPGHELDRRPARAKDGPHPGLDSRQPLDVDREVRLYRSMRKEWGDRLRKHVNKVRRDLYGR
jgi:hypothetical protein